MDKAEKRQTIYISKTLGTIFFTQTNLYGVLSFREEVHTTQPSFGVPSIAGFWGSFEYSKGHVFYEMMWYHDVDLASDLIREAFDNSFKATYGFYATWDRLASSVFPGVGILLGSN